MLPREASVGSHWLRAQNLCISMMHKVGGERQTWKARAFMWLASCCEVCECTQAVAWEPAGPLLLLPDWLSLPGTGPAPVMLSRMALPSTRLVPWRGVTPMGSAVLATLPAAPAPAQQQGVWSGSAQRHR